MHNFINEQCGYEDRGHEDRDDRPFFRDDE